MRGRVSSYVALLLGVTALAIGAAAHAATVDQCGDADMNGSVSVTDGVLVLRTAAELAGGCSVESRCDIDGNFAITVTDGVAALRLAAGLPVDLACRLTSRDFSDFQVFQFTHRLSFGYCPAVGGAAQLVLGRSGAGLVLNGSVVVEGTAGDPDCIADAMPTPPVACVKQMPIPQRTLTAEEQARVEAAFASIVIEQQSAPDCGRVPIEPCLIGEYNWDGFIVTDWECGEPRLPPDQAAALDDLLASLL
jgi:hypothetical protein